MKKSIKIIVAVILPVVVGWVVWTNRYNFYDFVMLRGYTPPAQIAQLAADVTMTSIGKNLFYVNKPQISGRQTFGEQCKETEQTIVLGCYTGTNIYIFKVDNPQLNGVEQTTAAHEMLHAAYSRLSSSEKKRIDKLTAAAFAKVTDPRIKSLAESYDKQAPGTVPNELHSILATEVRDVGPELEAYYAKYFSNRIKVVEYSEKYEKVFEDLKKQVSAYDADLALRKSEIENLQNDLEDQVRQLEQQKAQMDRLEASNQIRAYNAQVPAYNNAVSSYNSGLQHLKDLINQYNSIVQKRNEIAIQQQNLAQNLDSRLNPINSQ